MYRVLGVAVLSGLFVSTLYSVPAQEPPVQAKVDFVRDVQPILRDNCYECHGADKQMNGLRLDRRRSAMLGGTEVVIGPGSAQSSRLYLRLIGPAYGEPMPKDGKLSAAQIDTIKRWIDQGAEWPDAASGEAPEAPADPAAVKAIDSIRAGNYPAVRAAIAADPILGNRRGPGGSTPLMFAALYGHADAVRQMLEAGANPNVANDSGATALMWAVTDLRKTRLLLEHGADVNARSADARTPLLIACGIPGTLDVVRALLDAGAKTSVKAPWIADQITPLLEAARVGDAAMLRLLIERGAKVQDAGPVALGMALRAGCRECFDLLSKDAPPELLSGVMAMAGPPLGPALATLPMLARGADPRTLHPFVPGLTMLMLTAASDAIPADAAAALIARGADVNAQGPGGVTALALAKQRGRTAIVDLLLQAGARDERTAPAAPVPSPAASPRAAVARSLPLLQRTDVSFLKKSGCVSCHNNSLTAMTVAGARRRGLPVDEPIANLQARKIAAYLDAWRERALQGHAIPGESDTVGYIMMGLAAEKVPPSAATDAMARYLRLQQTADGSWKVFAHRPPIESSDIEVTVSAMRGLQAYAPIPERALAAAAVQRGLAWLKRALPATTEDRAFQLLGFAWTGSDKSAIRSAAKALIGEQRPDGGWAQLPSLDSDAYGTGEALVALLESGAITADDPVFKRGVDYLLKTQLADGSWLVHTRALPIQPQFDAEFPHGRDQFISSAATNWATQALIHASRKSGS